MRPSLLAVLTIGSIAGAAYSHQMPAGASSGKDTLVYIGTRTGDQAKGIYVFRLQSAGTEVFQNVTLVPLGLAAETPNPTFFEFDLKRRVLFAVNELDLFHGKPTGAVSAFSVAPGGTLQLLNQRPSMGTRPCHLAADAEGRHLIVTNCGSGTIAVFPLDADGRLGEASSVIQQPATSVSVGPGSRFVFACDRDADRIATYRFDPQKGTLAAHAPAFTAVKAGAGPRQMVFHPDGRFAYVVNEKNSSVSVFAYDAAAGALKEVQTASTLPEYFDGPNAAMEMHMHRTGKWLYVANSGHNSVVLFTVDAGSGALTFVEEQGTGGRNPKFFGIEPSAKHLAISNTDSNTVLASRIDEGNGRLKPSGIFADVPSPASIRFLPPQ